MKLFRPDRADFTPSRTDTLGEETSCFPFTCIWRLISKRSQHLHPGLYLRIG